MTTETGVIQSVTEDRLGSYLVGDHAAGVTTLTVQDAIDFNPDGGTLSVAGQAAQDWTSADPDSDVQTITLAAGLAAAANDGDRVDVWDASLPGPAVEYTAQVEIVADGLDGAGDPILARVDHALVPLLPLGIRDPGTGESVTVEQRAGQFWVSNVNGSTPQVDGSYLRVGTVDADKLTADLVFVEKTLYVGDPVGAHIELGDPNGLAQYGSDGTILNQLLPDGTANFNGDVATFNELDVDKMVMVTPDNGGIFIYGSTTTPLNANYTLASGMTPWQADGAGSLLYSGTHTYNGHSTMRVQRATSSGVRGCTSEDVSITAGNQYSISVRIFLASTGSGDPGNSPPCFAGITWLNGSHNVIGRANSGTTFTRGRWVTLTAGGGAPSGTQFARIHIANTSSSGDGDFYVGYAALLGPSDVRTVLTNTGGTDDFGNGYPAGLSTNVDVKARNLTATGEISAVNMPLGVLGRQDTSPTTGSIGTNTEHQFDTHMVSVVIPGARHLGVTVNAMFAIDTPPGAILGTIYRNSGTGVPTAVRGTCEVHTPNGVDASINWTFWDQIATAGTYTYMFSVTVRGTGAIHMESPGVGIVQPNGTNSLQIVVTDGGPA